MNELLAYMFCYYNSDHPEDLKMPVNKFYTSDAVIVAKKLLWQHYGDSLPSKVNRTSRGTKTPKQKNLEDILEGIKVLDETVDTLPVQFCAINLNNLPAKCAPEDPSDIRIRISTLESQMTERLSFKQHTLKNNGNYQSDIRQYHLISRFYYRANIQVHTFALLLLCNPLPVLIHIIVDRNVVNSK